MAWYCTCKDSIDCYGGELPNIVCKLGTGNYMNGVAVIDDDKEEEKETDKE